ICLAKAVCSGNLDHVISQDLVPGEGKALESGDAAEVRYSGWLFQNGTFGQMFDSNVNSDKLFRLKLGKGKVIKVSFNSRASTTPPSSQQSADVFGPVLLTETRQQNTEVRMAISKIGDKVDKVYEKLNDLHSIGGSSTSLGITAPNMEVTILIQNVTRIAQ
ncbi:hypothetical protein LOTGIDRAFT_176756, partial [Lottia gigantea]